LEGISTPTDVISLATPDNDDILFSVVETSCPACVTHGPVTSILEQKSCESGRARQAISVSFWTINNLRSIEYCVEIQYFKCSISNQITSYFHLQRGKFEYLFSSSAVARRSLLNLWCRSFGETRTDCELFVIYLSCFSYGYP